MAKQRRRTPEDPGQTESARPALRRKRVKKKRVRRSADHDRHGAAGDDDPLGDLILEHKTDPASVIVASIFTVILGIGMLATLFLLESPPVELFLVLLVGGGLIVLVGAGRLVLLGLSKNQRLEFRKRGLRILDGQLQFDLFWDEIRDIEVDRTDRTFVGIDTVTTHSSDAVMPSGPTTSTEWDVHIHTEDGRRIQLNPDFLSMVRDPKQLISNLKLRSGVA